MAQLDEEESLEDALDSALEAGDADRLLAFLTSSRGQAVPRPYSLAGVTVARKGDVACLRVLHKCGFTLSDWTWESAAEGGLVNCLEFAVSNKYKLHDRLLYAAASSGKLACVEFLLQQGLPRTPYLHTMDFLHEMDYLAADQLKCVQAVLDKGVAIDPKSLVVAAEWGQVEVVRLLHGRGVPLWQHARDAASPDEAPHQGGRALPYAGMPVTLEVPWDPSPLWEILRYGAVCGAPITLKVQELFEEKQERTHAVLLCFKAAARLCKCPGRARQRRVWAAMAAVPPALIEEFLILADLEIRESIMRCLPLRAPAPAL